MEHCPEWWSLRQTRRRFIVRLLFMLFLLADQALAGNKVRGIDPKDLSYFQGDSIWCKDGSKSFPRERLNDNFCDCPDGTDEPGTSACPASKYYCRNSGSVPKSMFASRVNDGICDCCDGSDEYEKRVNCANTCGGAVNEALDQSTTLNTSDGYKDIPHHQQIGIGEDLVSKLKGVSQNLFSCWKSNYHNKVICMWLPLFSILFLLAWMSRARVPRPLQLRRKKVSRRSLV